MDHVKRILLGFSLIAAISVNAAEAPALETVAVLDHPPGNITVTPDGTVVISIHPSLAPEFIGMAIKDGRSEPFPPGQWSTVLDEEDSGQPGMRPVLGVRAGREDGLLWMLSGGSGQAVKHIYAWDMAGQELAHEFTFDTPPATSEGSFFNDMALAPDHNTIFISDPAGGDNAAIVVVDLNSGTAIRRLEGHDSVRAEEIEAYINGKMLGFPGPGGQTTPLRGHLNPITIDTDEEWVYYGAMSGLSVYRVRVEDLLNDQLSAEALGQRVERYAEKSASAGITIDDAGNVYVADVQAHGVGVAAPGQPYRVLVQDSTLLSWPDGLSVGPDGYVYVGSNSLFRNFPSHADDGGPTAPFYVTRFKALGGTTAGR